MNVYQSRLKVFNLFAGGFVLRWLMVAPPHRNTDKDMALAMFIITSGYIKTGSNHIGQLKYPSRFSFGAGFPASISHYPPLLVGDGYQLTHVIKEGIPITPTNSETQLFARINLI